MHGMWIRGNSKPICPLKHDDKMENSTLKLYIWWRYGQRLQRINYCCLCDKAYSLQYDGGCTIFLFFRVAVILTGAPIHTRSTIHIQFIPIKCHIHNASHVQKLCYGMIMYMLSEMLLLNDDNDDEIKIISIEWHCNFIHIDFVLELKCSSSISIY